MNNQLCQFRLAIFVAFCLIPLITACPSTRDDGAEYSNAHIRLLPDAVQVSSGVVDDSGLYESVLIIDDAQTQEYISVDDPDYSNILENQPKQRMCCHDCSCDGTHCICIGCGPC